MLRRRGGERGGGKRGAGGMGGKAGFIFTLDDIMKSLELFLKLM